MKDWNYSKTMTMKKNEQIVDFDEIEALFLEVALKNWSIEHV